MGLLMIFGSFALAIVSNLLHKHIKNKHQNDGKKDKYKKPKLLAEKNQHNDKEDKENKEQKNSKEENTEIEKEEKK